MSVSGTYWRAALVSVLASVATGALVFITVWFTAVADTPSREEVLRLTTDNAVQIRELYKDLNLIKVEQARNGDKIDIVSDKQDRFESKLDSLLLEIRRIQ